MTDIAARTSSEAPLTMVSEIMSTYLVNIPEWDGPASEQLDRTNFLLHGAVNRSGVVDRLQKGEASKVLLELTTSYMGLHRIPHKYCIRAMLLVDALTYATEPSASRLSKEVLIDLIDSGLTEIYFDLILDSSFCRPQGEGDMRLVIALFRGVYHILSFMRQHPLVLTDDGLDDIVHRNLPRMWRRVWEDRTILLHRYEAGAEYSPEENVIEACLHMSAYFYRMRLDGDCLPPSSYIPHVALSLWLDCDVPASRALQHPYVGCICDPYQDGIEVIQFLESVVVKVYGGNIIFDKIDGVMKSNTGKREATNWHASVILTLLFMTNILQDYALFNQFRARDTFQHVLDMLQDHTRSLRDERAVLEEEYDPWIIWAGVAGIIKAVYYTIDQTRNGAGPSFSPNKFSGQEIVSVITCALELVALGHSPVEKGETGIDQLRETDLLHVIGLLPLYHNATRNQRLEWELNEGIKRGMREHWYDGVHFLRSAQYRLGDHARAYEDVEKAWIRAGKCYGLNELAEKRRHQREARKYCSDVGCPYSRTDPLDALLACKGCGEAWYCDAGCQMRDWKKGGHKKACGRRLKAA
ncbi:hypothetical protein PENSPDRAFT_686511 [Peniophora sp. CONT]|nr:hypothetical protein PENSPDRAFT_686511 [Peniophora sp. CONT]